MIFRIFRELIVRLVRSKTFHQTACIAVIFLVRISSKFEPSSRFFGRLKICKDPQGCKEDLRGLVGTEFANLKDLVTTLSNIQGTWADKRTCRQRQQDRFPPHVRALFDSAKEANTKEIWHCQRKAAWTALKQHVEECKVQKLETKVCRGSVPSRSKKLYAINTLLHNGQRLRNPEDWMQPIRDVFAAKWGAENLQERLNVIEYCIVHEGVGIPFTAQELISACERIRYKTSLDSYGLSVIVVKWWIAACPSEATSFFERLTSSTPDASQLLVTGRVVGKTSADPPSDKLRTILPLPAVLQVIDVCISDRINAFIDSLGPLPDGAYEGARPKTQSLEISAALQLWQEKAMDNHSKGGIAQSDIETFYDTLRILRICRWLHSKGLAIGVCVAALRMQMLPTVSLRTATVTIEISGRSSGGLTGSRTAGALSRVPVHDIIRRRGDLWAALGGTTVDGPVSLSTYVDNLFSIGDSPEAAVAIQVDFEKELRHQWSQTIKPSSRSILVPLGCDQLLPDAATWPSEDLMHCLGFMIQNNAETNVAWKETVKILWKAYFANFRSKDAKGLTKKAKLSVLDRSVLTSLKYRTACMPITPCRVQAIDTVQRKMTAAVLGIRRCPDEQPDHFCRRKWRAASAAMKQQGLWSTKVCISFWKFDSHIRRDTAKNLWAARLLRTRNAEWLRQRREEFGKPGWSRTMSRKVVGHVARRWDEAAKFAKAHVPRWMLERDSQGF